MANTLNITAETLAMRDGAINPHDLGLLFSMVPGMPESYAKRFQAAVTWRDISVVHEQLLEYCRRERISVIQ